MEGDKEDLLLLLDHDGKLALFTLHVFNHLCVALGTLSLLQIFGFLFEFTNAHDIALDLVIDNPHCGISNLVNGEELMELGEI